MYTKTRLITTISAILIVAVLVIVGAVTKAQTSQTNAQVVILNLLNGQQYFGVPHVYQGDNNSAPTSQWPVYYGPSTASQYWGPVSSSINQPVLMMVPAQFSSASAMFWSETYSGGSVTITMVSTFSEGSSPPADGLEIYLFLKPTMWGISPAYNWSIPYWATKSYPYPSPAAGDVILPQSSTSYLIIQWDPWWQISYTTSGATGQWNVWIVSNPNGNNPSVSPSPSPNLGSGYACWDGIGTGAFRPNPGDRINITVTYDPSTNTLSGVATDLNTGQSANFTVNLNGYWTPPGSGNYVFGVGAATGYGNANWALLYVVLMGNVKPSTSTTSTTTPTTITVTTTATTTSTVTSTVTSLVTSTVTSPVTTTVASTTASTVTTTSPVTVTTTVSTTSSIIQTVIIALIIIIVVLAAALVAVTIRRR